MGITGEDVKAGGKPAALFQEALVVKQVELETKAGDNFVTERSIDPFIYTAFQADNTCALWAKYGLKRIADLTRPDVVLLLVAPSYHAFQYAQRQGERRAWLDWEEINRMYGAMRFLLEVSAIPYTPVLPGDRREQLALVRTVLELRGLTPKDKVLKSD